MYLTSGLKMTELFTSHLHIQYPGLVPTLVLPGKLATGAFGVRDPGGPLDTTPYV